MSRGHRHRTRARLVIAALAVVAAACSSDTIDPEQPSTSAPVTTAGPAAETAPPPTTTAAPAATTTTAGTEAVSTFVGPDGVETVVTDVSRIVSLNGDVTEIIYELGLGDNVVAVDVTTTFPDDAVAKIERGETVGFGQSLSAEAVLRFAPTLVIGDQQIQPPEVIEQLRGAGIPVAIITTQATLAGVETKIGEIAGILGVFDAGVALAQRVNGEIDEALTLAAGASNQPNVAYVYARGPETLLLFGAGMPTQAMIEGANAVDVAAASGVFGPAPLTPEALVAAAPDIIVLPEAGLGALGGVDALLAIPGIADTPAGQAGAFLAYDEAFFFNLGPRVGQALRQFVFDVHPELGSTG